MVELDCLTVGRRAAHQKGVNHNTLGHVTLDGVWQRDQKDALESSLHAREPVVPCVFLVTLVIHAPLPWSMYAEIQNTRL